MTAAAYKIGERVWFRRLYSTEFQPATVTRTADDQRLFEVTLADGSIDHAMQIQLKPWENAGKS